MFAVIYQGFVKPEFEIEYQQLWHQIATFFIEHCGALGSCLHKTEGGMWLAYSRWPDKATRDAAWPSDETLPSEKLPVEIRHAIHKIKECLDRDRKIPEIHMTVINDLL